MKLKKNLIKCPECGEELSFSIGYTGADWKTKAGEGSGYGYEVSLNCSCGRVYPIGSIKNESDFAEIKDELKSFK